MIFRRVLQALAILAAGSALVGVFAWTIVRFMQAAAGQGLEKRGLVWGLLLVLVLISALAVVLFNLGRRSARRRDATPRGE